MPPAKTADHAPYPRRLVEYLTLDTGRAFRVAGHVLRERSLARLNAALREISPGSPGLELDQVAVAAQRAVDHHPEGARCAFVASRLASLARLQALCADPGWDAPAALARQLDAIAAYAADPDALLPATVPVVGRLDEAILVDVLCQQAGAELAAYEDCCRFRQQVADGGGPAPDASGPGGAHWLDALSQASAPPETGGCPAPDPRRSLFHVA